ncbi:MAG TPA: hypothetical protein VGM98_07340 [Schlesneria sp.]
MNRFLKFQRQRIYTFVGVAVSVILASAVSGFSSDDTESARGGTEDLKIRRFELMHSRVAAVKVESDKPGIPSQFATKPIFKYSDPARGYVAASVWKLGGDQKRPLALLAVELDRNTYGRPCIGYEYGSITDRPLKVQFDKFTWTPKSTLYEFKQIPDAPPPEKTPQLRLIQLRSLAKRFASTEVVKNEKCELRLLPQPVDRYEPSEVDRADGAVFFFTFGTNPEVVLLIESNGHSWSYAAGRMTGAQEVVLTFDDAIAWQGAPLQQGKESPFTGHIEPIDIPGIDRNGKEIAE